MSFSIERISQTPEETCLRLSGVIDEHANLIALAAPSTGTLVLDLAEVERINSIGVGRWIRACSTLPPELPIIWERVSVAMAIQVTMIANFTGNARIRSFFAPYYCPTTDTEHDVLLTMDDFPENTETPPVQQSPDGHTMTFDDVSEGYFSSLLALKAP